MAIPGLLSAHALNSRRTAKNPILDVMSTLGSSIETSVLQAAQAQRMASKARDKERADSGSSKRMADILDLKTAAVEGVDAPRRLPGNDSEEMADEQRAKHHHPDATGDNEPPRIDVTA